MSSQWFCNSCHSLNARGAKRCYSCGAREDYLGLDALTGVPPTMPAGSTPTGRAAAGETVISLGAATGSMAFAGDRPRALPRGRTRPKSVAAILISVIVLVAVIATAAILGIGRGPVAGSAAGPAVSSTPGTSVASAAPSAVAFASPGPSSHAAPKPGASGQPAAPTESPLPQATPLPVATFPVATPLPTATPLPSATPFPPGSPLPPDQLGSALEHLVRSTSFSGHVDMTVDYQLSGLHGKATGDIDFSGNDLRSHQVIRFPSLHRTQESWLIVCRTALYTRMSGPWKRVYVRPPLVAENVLNYLRSAEKLATPTPATGADRGLWIIHWPAQEAYGRQLLRVFVSSGWTARSMDITILVRPDGVPVRVDMNLLATRRQNGHLQRFGIVGSWTYSQVGAGVTITPPSLGSGQHA